MRWPCGTIRSHKIKYFICCLVKVAFFFNKVQLRKSTCNKNNIEEIIAQKISLFSQLSVRFSTFSVIFA